MIAGMLQNSCIKFRPAKRHTKAGLVEGDQVGGAVKFAGLIAPHGESFLGDDLRLQMQPVSCL